jgi:AcrR family transcriptional regulator
MTAKEKDTEEKILQSAKNIFIAKGMDGARMQEIADDAGINKALLHYYFRSKEKLFDAIFQDAFKKFVPVMSDVFQSGEPFFKKIETFIYKYLTVLDENQFIPLFIMRELNRNPDRLFNLIMGTNLKPMIFFNAIIQEMEKGTIKKLDPRHLMVHILSLCVFPYAAKPLVKKVLFYDDDEEYRKFLVERKKEVTNFVINAIKA